MADTPARLNQITMWTPASGADTITCYDVSAQIRNGVQVEADGFDIDSATVVVTLRSGAQKTVTVAASTGEAALVGEGFQMSAVRLSGITGGPFPVLFSQ